MIDFDRDVPKVELGFMNEDHAHSTDITNRLFELVNHHPEQKENISTVFQELIDHNREHFGREEQMMQEHQFPPYPVHKNEHDRVIKEMEDELAQWQNSGNIEQLNQYCHHILLQWFLNHIATMDTVTARYISQNS